MRGVIDVDLDSLPELVCHSKTWSGTKHTLEFKRSDKSPNSDFVEFTVVSRPDKGGNSRLRAVTLHTGSSANSALGRSPLQISTSRSDFVEPYARELIRDSWIEVRAIYKQWAPSTARNILTGHYLAIHHKKLFDELLKQGNTASAYKKATEIYWAPLVEEAGGVTRLTAKIYEELTMWGESSSASLLSELMGTGPRTIHTRLQEARKLGYLDKPGIGTRRVNLDSR
jgi:hypothetical protein